MDYSVDVSYELKSVQSKLFRLSLMFAIILTIIITADILLVTLSKEDYLVNLIISIIITIIFIWFAIYFFFNIYSEVNNKYRFFKGFESGIHPIEEVEYLGKSDEMTYMNGLYVYPIYVKYIDGLNRKDKTIFTTNPNLSYEIGDKLSITTYQRIIVKAEQHL